MVDAMVEEGTPSVRTGFGQKCCQHHPPAQMCPCGKEVENRAHIVGGCKIHKVEWDVVEVEMRKIDE